MQEQNELTKCVKNVMVTSCLMLSDPENQSRQRLITSATGPWEAWHSLQNTRLRSTDDTIEWSQEQITGSYMAVQHEVFAKMRDTNTLDYIGFELDFFSEEFEGLHPSSVQCARQDDLADNLGSLAVSLGFMRVRRSAWLLSGWPARSCLFLMEDRKDAAISELKCDWQNYQQLVAMSTTEAKRLVHRSVFKLTPVLQLVRVLAAPEWSLTGDARGHITSRNQRLLGSQIVEDGFREQRAFEKSFPNKKPPPAGLWSALLKGKVISERHHFQEIAPRSILETRDTGLPGQLFEKRNHKQTLALHEVMSFKAQPAWWTASPAALAAPFADLHMIRWCLAREAGVSLLKTNVGFIVNGARVLLSYEGTNDWFFVLGHIADSCVVAVPALRETVPETNIEHWVPKQVDQPSWLCVCEHEKWKAMSYTWRSPLWQYAATPGSRSKPWKFSEVRAIPDEIDGQTVLPLMQLAAKRAFWTTGVTQLRSLAKIIGCSGRIPPKADLFAIVMTMVQFVLEVDEERAISIIEQRLGSMSELNFSSCAELMEVDEAIEMFGKEEAEEVKAEKKKQEQIITTHRSFTRRYMEKKSAIVKARAQSASSNSRRRGGAAPAKARNSAAGRRAVIPAGHIGQAAAKEMLPPRCHIWRDLCQGGWQAHLEGFPRISASWAKYSERDSLLHVLRHVWRCHLEREGLALSECGVVGLF